MEMMGALILALVAAAGAQQSTNLEEAAGLRMEISGLRSQVAALHAELRTRAEAVDAMRRDLAALGDDIGALKDRPAASLAGPFLASPPPSSDSAGVAKVAVFSPRLHIDALRRHDVLSVRLRRLESGGARVVAETEISSDQSTLDLPLDQNGALYVLDWQTSEGHSYALVLEDGASGLPVSTVQVRPQQTKGRFLFVAYRVD
jgi:hypothetical protein